MVVPIQEPITVLAAFGVGHLSPRPMQLMWKQTRYSLGPVDFMHVTKKGSERVYHFSLTDETGGTYFKVAFYSHTLRWFLEEVEDGSWA